MEDLKTIGELSAKSRDRIIATGEKLACRIVVASLKNEVRPHRLYTNAPAITFDLISLRVLMHNSFHYTILC